MNKYIVERTDGKTDHISADFYKISEGFVYFVTHKNIIGEGETEFPEYFYISSNIIRIIDIGKVEENEESEESEDPKRHKNDNEDLISRKGLILFLQTHYFADIIEVIKSFEKAEYLD